MRKLVYKLVYIDGTTRFTEVKASVPCSVLNQIIDSWHKLGIQANLEAIV